MRLSFVFYCYVISSLLREAPLLNVHFHETFILRLLCRNSSGQFGAVVVRSLSGPLTGAAAAPPSGRRAEGHVSLGGRLVPLHLLGQPTSLVEVLLAPTTSRSAGNKMEDVAFQSGGRSGGIVVKTAE